MSTPYDAEWLEYDDNTRPVKKQSAVSVFAEPLAQAREALRAFRNVAMFESYPESIADDGLAALDLIEQRAADMERWIDTVMAQGGPVTSDYAEGERLLAALSAREEAR